MSLKITICACSSRTIIDGAKVAEVASALVNAGCDVKIEADLCKTAITSTEAMCDAASSTVLACYPRAVNSLFANLNLKPKQVLDIRNAGSKELLTQLGVSAPSSELAEIAPLPADEGQEAWYPIIDKERCTECGKCHDFCLFGVYSIVDGKVEVKQPQNCKNNCPACARVCPKKAIIFPKYEKSPINGGLLDEEQAMEIDTKALYANALKLKLEQRRAGVSLLKKDNK